MLGPRRSTGDGVHAARRRTDELLAAYRAVAAEVASTPDDGGPPLSRPSSRMSPPTSCSPSTARSSTGCAWPRARTPTPLNELELLVDSLSTNDGVLRSSSVITYVPGRSVLGLRPDDRIRPSVEDVAGLATSVYAELEERFVEASAA